MTRSTFWFMALCIGVGLLLFRIKYQVMALEQHYKRIENSIIENKEAIHILNAEWAHLNDPKRIQTLTKKYLPLLKPVESQQLVSFQDLAHSHNDAPSSDALESYLARLAKDDDSISEKEKS